MRPLFQVSLLSTLILLTACGGESSAPSITPQQSMALQPADPTLAEIYNRSCKSCHTMSSTGAPLTGDAVAWGTRMDKGMDVLVDNVINGFAGMPPFGLCMDCEPEQFEALIEFMAKAPQ